MIQSFYITPPSLKPGDTIAIISPATEVKEHWIRGAADELIRRGYKIRVMPYAAGPRCGSYAASDSQRLADLTEAIINPEIKSILCARGGYGSIHLLSEELQRLVRQNPKWIIGFSDISALHALWLKAQVKSLHCSMAKQLTLYDIESHAEDIRAFSESEIPTADELPRLKECTDIMMSIITGEGRSFLYETSTAEGSIAGEAEGYIAGGNLAVLNGLAATPWDILDKEFLRGKILFLEDVGEKIYQVERMLTRLHLAGVFGSVTGVIFGQFTDYKPDSNFSSMEAMIAHRLKEWKVKCPVALSFPIGHTAVNFPITEGTSARLTVTPNHVSLCLT